eukprot:6782547-Ditylum_brightwellii.AAC.1
MQKKALYTSDMHCGVMYENTFPALAIALLGKDSSTPFGTRKKAVQKGEEFYTSSCPLVPDISLGRM